MFFLLIFLILGFIFKPVLTGIILGVVIIVGIIFMIYDDKCLKKLAEEKKKEEQKRTEDKKHAEETVQNIIKQLTGKYGRLSNIVRLEKWCDMADIKKCLLVFGDSELLYIDGREVMFKDVISYNIADSRIIKHGDIECASKSKTKTSTKSLLGRSVAGAVLAGGVGALIGASSASKNTTTITTSTRKNDKIIHKYFLSINIKSLENPLIRISLGESAKRAEEVNAILAYIIDLNKERR